ncbi:glycosyl transferase family 2 [Caballeronia hypogeia]|uniref:Glycosyl transferase family 2 n=2 Tax=Caballeronia hypogeia TaxID=1777140 RepID=A0A158BF45_9BURK|nr:glycosyl transferase family 2 [Caballeronia hypogeia]
MPNVCIIIPCFNAARTLSRALNSCLAQEAAQVIVVDDNSQDSSAAIVQYYALKDRRVELLKMCENCGPAKARNYGANHAKYPVLAFLDADDEYLPGALATATTYLSQNPLRPAVRLDVDFSTFPSEIIAGPNFEQLAHVMSDSVASSLVIKRSVFLALGGFPFDEVFRRYGGEDSALSNAVNDIYGCFRIGGRKWVRMHYHQNSHAARFFRRAMGEPMHPREHSEIVEAIDRFVQRARQAIYPEAG